MNKTKSAVMRTLDHVDNLANSEYLKGKKIDDFSIKDLLQIKSSDLRQLYRNQIEHISEKNIKTIKKLPNEEVFQFEQSEIKELTKKLREYHAKYIKDGLSIREYEKECVSYITDKYKRYFFNSIWAQRMYKLNNYIFSGGLSYWGYRAVGKLGNTKPLFLQEELSKSFLPIVYFTGITCKFWAYITKPLPPVSKTFDTISNLAMSPIWLMEYVINSITGPIFKNSPLKTEIPLNITGEVAAGSGLTWDKLNHTYQFVKEMTRDWENFPT